MATFVFVHGAFQGGWVWKDVVNALRAMGHDAHAPTLSGCGYLHHGLREGVGLHSYIQDVVNYLDFMDLSDVTLVGHSYSGLICGAVMMRTPNRLRKAVLVDTLIPEPNRSFAETAGEAFQHMLEGNRVNGWKVAPWPVKVFGVPEDKAPWFQKRLCEFPHAAFTTPFPGEFEPSLVDTAFITCGKTLSPFIRAMAERAKAYGWKVDELAESGHCPMVTHPQELTDLLLAAVGEGMGS